MKNKDNYKSRGKADQAAREADFDQVYTQFFPDLFKYGQYYTDDLELIKDVIQDLFIQLWSKNNLKQVSSLKSYLFISFRNNLRQALKARKSEAQSALFDFFYEETSLSHERDIIKTEEKKFTQEQLHKALDQLNQRKKEALFLRFFNEISYEEIATILNLKSTKHARMVIYRALAELKKEFLKRHLTLFLLPLIFIIIRFFKIF